MMTVTFEDGKTVEFRGDHLWLPEGRGVYLEDDKESELRGLVDGIERALERQSGA